MINFEQKLSKIINQLKTVGSIHSMRVSFTGQRAYDLGLLIELMARIADMHEFTEEEVIEFTELLEGKFPDED